MAIAFYAEDNLFSEEQTEALFYLIDALDEEHVRRVEDKMRKDEQRARHAARTSRENGKPS